MTAAPGLDLDYGDDAAAIASAVRTLCERTPAEVESALPPGQLWTALADMGVFGLAASVDGDLEAMSAAMVELGRAAVRGPLVATAFAVRILDPDEVKAVTAGDELVSVGAPPLMPWATQTARFIELDGHRAWRAQPDGPVDPVETLAEEPWGRCRVARGDELSDVEAALAVADVALSSYLCGAGERLLAAATSYASQRTQFGRSIGEFQGVSFPLADVRVGLTAAGVLARTAAYALSRDEPSAPADAVVARSSATGAALAAAYRAHQTFGAMGFTVEGPIGRVSTLIRQASLFGLPPRDLRETILAPHHI